MITEDYVSFEVAKLLKEKGFDGECDLFFRTDETELITREASKIAYNQGIDDECVILPTIQMTMKWLREVHNLHIVVDYDFVLGWYCQITSLRETVEYDYEEMKHYHPGESNGFSSPEEACEAAIKYCLENLI